MDKRTLVDMDIKGGQRMLEILDESNLKISSAFWFYVVDVEEWRLFFATSEVDSQGPKKVYSKVQKVINKYSNEINIPLEVVTLISPKNQLNVLLKMAINTGSGMSGVRFSGNVINGFLIKDSYLYRVT